MRRAKVSGSRGIRDLRENWQRLENIETKVLPRNSNIRDFYSSATKMEFSAEIRTENRFPCSSMKQMNERSGNFGSATATVKHAEQKVWLRMFAKDESHLSKQDNLRILRFPWKTCCGIFLENRFSLNFNLKYEIAIFIKCLV